MIGWPTYIEDVVECLRFVWLTSKPASQYHCCFSRFILALRILHTRLFFLFISFSGFLIHFDFRVVFLEARPQIDGRFFSLSGRMRVRIPKAEQNKNDVPKTNRLFSEAVSLKFARLIYVCLFVFNGKEQRRQNCISNFTRWSFRTANIKGALSLRRLQTRTSMQTKLSAARFVKKRELKKPKIRGEQEKESRKFFSAILSWEDPLNASRTMSLMHRITHGPYSHYTATCLFETSRKLLGLRVVVQYRRNH